MWFVKYGNEYLHDPRIGLILPTTKPTVELNTSTTFQFSIAYNHPLYNVIRERDPDNAVVVYQGYDIVYRGEISNIELDFKLTKTVTCTSDLGFFNGSILRPYSTISGECNRTCPSTVDGYFDFLVKEHNKQSSIARQFKMGINNGDQIYPNNYIYRSDVDYPTVGETIKDSIIESLGGYLRVRYEKDGTYIDLLSDMPDVNAQIIDFGVNLLDYTDETNSEDIASFIVPIGKDIEKANDDRDTLANKLTISKSSIPYLQVVVDKRTAERKETNDSLYSANQSVKEAQQKLNDAKASGDADEIKSAEEQLQSAQEQAQNAQENHDAATEALELAKNILSDAESATVDRQIMEGYHKSGDIIYSDEAVNKYGWIGAMVDYSDITVVSDLIIYGLISLKSLESPVKTITLSAFDLSMINPNAKPIKLGEYVRVRSKPHGVDSYFLCTKIEYDLNNPSNNKFTLGTTFDTLTGQQNRRIKALNATINNVYEAASKISDEAKAASKMATYALQKIASIDGKYIHIRYSANSDGSNMTTTPTDNTKYIGIYSGNSETAPTNNSKYVWSLIKGSDGVGVKGEDGKSAYLHIKYSNDGKTFTSNDGEDPGDWIGTCTDENADDPTGFESYTWKLINGIKSTTVTYQASSSGTIIPTGIWDENIPSVKAGQYLWTRTTTEYTDDSSTTSYSVSMMGNDGQNGTDGRGVKHTEVTYQAGCSGTVIPTGKWSTEIPAASSSTPYIWTRTIITYTDDTTSTSYNVGCTPEGIQVGGRNLLLRSRSLDEDYYTNSNQAISMTDITTNDVSYSVAHVKRDDMTSDGQYVDYKYTYELHNLKPNTAYTLSFWAKGNGVAESFLGSHIKQIVNSDGYIDTRFDGRSMITLSNDWKRCWITWTTSDDFAEESTSLSLLRIAYSTTGHATEWYMYAPKFEIGNKATDWTPAPEDIDVDLKDLDTNIRDTITDASKDTLDASKDMMNDKLNDYVQNGTYDSFKQSVEAKLEIMDSDIAMNFNTVTESINNVDSSLNTRFSELTKYIRFSNDGIEIGASKNELKLTLDNDMIRFTKNREPIGWWDGNDFHTGNLVVEVNEHAQFGNFSFVPRSDGSLMFLKVKD